ncbi:MAG TPA: UbiA family prenyltransferase [Nocardioides sp.]|uniref:UbiA family prenyltransferase n=1 Tax=Nocardioides sp. TaxID=35761 RepID=UPI002D7EE721|nr:UbiA family prenyltransferase [Nocardioides sp.]HET6653697.1 UbiA family prenyltransferase [Nocardioides sp.]
MRFRKQRGQTVSLALAAHPLPAAAMTVALTTAAALSGRSARECVLVAVTVLSGQLTVGWINDLVDRHRDRQVGRQDKPVAMGWVDPGTVAFAAAVATLLVVPLSIANGTYAGIAHLGAVGSAWLYNFWFKRTWLSWLPYAVSFGLLPAFLSYGGLGGGMHGAPPTIEMTVLAALFGVGVHFLNALPDLVEDKETGVRHLPLRIALRIGAPRLLWISVGYTVLVGAGLVAAAFTVGLRQ